MEDLLKEALALVVKLKNRNEEMSARELKLSQASDVIAGKTKELKEWENELSNREAALEPIESLQSLIESSKELSAKASLETDKVLAERKQLEADKKVAADKLAKGMAEVSDLKALYDRGAEENKVTREKLEKKLKQVNEFKVSV